MIQDGSTQLLRRLERGALVWCALAAGAVLVIAPSRTDVLLGIAGGGVLAIVSFYAIRGSVDAPAPQPQSLPAPEPVPAPSPQDRTGRGPLVAKLAGRYALLALLAYVMIARLRLHPLGLLLGMTALAASATAEAVRSLGRPGPAS